MLAIVVYTKSSSSSSRKAKKWLNENNICFTERNIDKKVLTAEELKEILTLTESGVEDIISFRSTAFKELQLDVESMTFEKAVQLMTETPDLLRLPIIKDRKRLQIGFHAGDIRQFLPKETRRKQLSLLKHFELSMDSF